VAEGEPAGAESWVAIDFETASVRGTPCAVGIVEVENGVVGESRGWLIRPPLFEFSPFNIALHGITPDMCRDAPGWIESLAEIERIRRGRPVLAHNASFDVGVIRDACDRVDVPWPSLTYACSLVLSRRLWPDLDSYSLPYVAGSLAISPGEHHNARADARMAAELGYMALRETGATTLAGAVDSVGALMGRLDHQEWMGCRLRDLRAALPTEPTPGTELDSAHPFFGKTITFTGALAIPRREAMQAVVDCGALASRGVTRKTDVLITGFQDLTRLARGESQSAKLRKAQNLIAKGQEIEILGESDFVKLLAGISSFHGAWPR
jgi:DNA polymerase-3 subunit epsilon